MDSCRLFDPQYGDPLNNTVQYLILTVAVAVSVKEHVPCNGISIIYCAVMGFCSRLSHSTKLYWGLFFLLANIASYHYILQDVLTLVAHILSFVGGVGWSLFSSIPYQVQFAHRCLSIVRENTIQLICDESIPTEDDSSITNSPIVVLRN
ncbi:hypothetical protein BC833DRAFT_166495 [Globomyces pollinis-pini]|nr:hypothetical protein BC833DRAFT_166495 [Globomyces pollinis-pini]